MVYQVIDSDRELIANSLFPKPHVTQEERDQWLNVINGNVDTASLLQATAQYRELTQDKERKSISVWLRRRSDLLKSKTPSLELYRLASHIEHGFSKSENTEEPESFLEIFSLYFQTNRLIKISNILGYIRRSLQYTISDIFVSCKKHFIKRWFLYYILIAIFTSGYYASHFTRTQCDMSEPSCRFDRTNDGPDQVVGALLFGAAWPFYWSYELQLWGLSKK